MYIGSDDLELNVIMYVWIWKSNAVHYLQTFICEAQLEVLV
jgi:hypothetical protein